MERYHILELIGEGSFGKVYKGKKEILRTGELTSACWRFESLTAKRWFDRIFVAVDEFHGQTPGGKDEDANLILLS